MDLKMIGTQRNENLPQSFKQIFRFLNYVKFILSEHIKNTIFAKNMIGQAEKPKMSDVVTKLCKKKSQ